MLSYLVPGECSVKVQLRDLQKEDLELMEAQKDTICSMDMNTNQFILPVILDEIKRLCTIEGVSPDFFNISAEELQNILDGDSLQSTLSQERITDFLNILFSAEIDNGSLVCVACNEVYPINNNIVDFVQKEDV
ncbi:hypothetical protein NEMIN01_1357 [Nematocida minor]|uniref:uncharacterized protein n=1 Tax=Nematocida minor TaxID=1912983 RepID=UPI00221E5F1E|nr:uncharacterized protein NEMIN01_1357 [Nematocida minor]KAI5191088.1 hypothetical protein NEMIN01_1357 [Nematocida minor]